MGIVDRAKLVVRSEIAAARSRVTFAGVEAVGRAAALGAWFPAVPRVLAEMPRSISESLVARRGDFSAEALYDLIPDGVKTESARVAAFLGKRDLSHIESVENAPHRESDIANVLFERMEWNRARGSENMTALDLSRARLDNFAEGVIAGVQATTAAATQGAIAASLLELPVTTVENFLLVKAKERTGGGGRRESVQRYRHAGRARSSRDHRLHRPRDVRRSHPYGRDALGCRWRDLVRVVCLRPHLESQRKAAPLPAGSWKLRIRVSAPATPRVVRYDPSRDVRPGAEDPYTRTASPSWRAVR